MLEHLTKKRQEEGFTLVELLVVIVILAILAAIVVFAVTGISDKGQTSACKTDKAAIQTAEEAYYARQTVSPSTYTDMAGLTSGGFLKSSSQYFTISVPSGGASYTLSTTSTNTVCS